MDCMMNEQPEANNRTFMIHAVAESKTQQQLAAEVIDRITTGFTCKQPEELRRILHKFALNCAGRFREPHHPQADSKKTYYLKTDDEFPNEAEPFKILFLMTVFVAMNAKHMLQSISKSAVAHRIKWVADFKAEFCRDVTVRHFALWEGSTHWEIVTEIHNTVRLLEYAFGPAGNKRAFAYVAGILSVPATHAQFLAANFTVNSFGGRESPRVKMLRNYVESLLNLTAKRRLSPATQTAMAGLISLSQSV